MHWKKRKIVVPRQETVNEELLSLIPHRQRNGILAALGVFGMIQNDIAGDEGAIQRCPKCDQMSLRKQTAHDTESDEKHWVCFECGNDTDEFGNRL